MTNRWQYLSHCLNATTPSYGNRAGFTELKEERGWKFPVHIGTHVDAPNHFVEGGISIERFPADFWHFTSPLLIDLPKEADELIEANDLEKALQPRGVNLPDALLIRTGFEKYRGTELYWSANPGFTEGAAQWLRMKLPSVRLLGLDMISVNGWKHREEGRRAHKALLQSPDFAIVEDMTLSEGNGELSEMWVAPLRVSAADGAPCTVWGGFR